MLATGKVRSLRHGLQGMQALMSSSKETSAQWQSADVVPAAAVSSANSAVASGPDAGVAAAAAAVSGGVEAGAEPVGKKEHVAWKLFRGVIYLAGAAAVGGSAYVSYAYKVEDVEGYVSSLRSSANFKASEDVNLIERMRRSAYSTSVSGVAKVADYYLELRRSIEDQVRGFSAPSTSKLLPDLLPQEKHIYTLVLDLNETIVFSDWKRDRGWSTFKRPGVDAFLEQLAQYYEIVIYSDQLSFYVDPILDRLDPKGCIRYRLSRDATQYIDGKHMRDISKLNRDPARVIYLAGHAAETTLQPENALTVKPWKLETEDTTLLDLLPFLEYVARNRPTDIRAVLASYQGHDIPSEFRLRHKEYQRRMQERKQQSRFWRGSSINRSSQ
ncbi:mitochondrial import inner membrane translocase subunit TIM50 [Marchantia polymorpha subsp. ruderalis]|uniref:Mitochondrial import inner membrane translocase subunit TIM50 n=2 Tax=Marchantia polymorpha TaxID=3197 RepID=A0A176VPG0_MARPO|nr:hypothetical protein AXG93_3491s1140 [Marchantia polymorpha subsp. ruderalis]PTQ44997.1 hypothetical protein MARPO_0016s0061 [Marchantia polymorpha]BBN14262.1 hypothetical protein Mp_6g10180 [Marchantia polymorpha subsp. ruderalis]|eukprot:PTQ44997.1 hypothetical protein MARPO_0016s0061 [Marchantia polymorpha]